MLLEKMGFVKGIQYASHAEAVAGAYADGKLLQYFRRRKHDDFIPVACGGEIVGIKQAGKECQGFGF